MDDDDAAQTNPPVVAEQAKLAGPVETGPIRGVADAIARLGVRGLDLLEMVLKSRRDEPTWRRFLILLFVLAGLYWILLGAPPKSSVVLEWAWPWFGK